jgi:hypothetical protein
MNLIRLVSRGRGPEKLGPTRGRAGAWLLEQVRPDGGVAAYHKSLAALQVSGHTAAADRLCSWIVANEMTRDGDFGRAPRDTKGELAIYRNAWIVIGAHRLGRFDLSQPGMDFLAGFWDAESGGFYSHPLRRDAETKQDLMVVGFCGLAALYTGRLDIARGAGRWLATVLNAQPEFPQRLYTVYTRGTGLQVVPASETNRRYVVSSAATHDQLFFQPGIAGAFLARLFQATGQAEWLRLAEQYMRFAEVASDHLFRLLRAGKVGWAAALLYTISGEPKYRQMALRVRHTLAAAQRPQGYWHALDASRADVDVTAEMIVWLDAIDQAVGPGSAPSEG